MADGMQTDKPAGRVLKFEQKAEFFYKRGDDKLDKNDLVSALCSYRRALERDPQDQQKRIAMAEVLSKMERYDDANRTLIPLLSRKDTAPEAYFELGCNFAALDEALNAQRMLNNYLNTEPDGIYAYEAYDLLDAIAEEEYTNAGPGVLAEVSKADAALDEAERGRQLLEEGQFKPALRALEHALKLDPMLHYARNNMSIALFCSREYAKAIEQADKVLAVDEYNLQALCNKVLICNACGLDDTANAAADKLAKAQTENEDELGRISVAFMEMKRYDEALIFAKRLLKKLPYDEAALHNYGMCNYELKQYDIACKAYDKLCLIDPNDTVAKYYKKQCIDAANGKITPGGRREPFFSGYRVPFEEMLRRLNRINAIVAQAIENNKEALHLTPEFEALMRWAFTLPEGEIYDAMLASIELMDIADCAKIEALLRDVLLLRNVDGATKHKIVVMLSIMHAQEPFYFYAGNVLIEARPQANKTRSVSRFGKVMTLCINGIGGLDNPITAEAIGIMGRYIARQPKLQRMSTAQQEAFAAALEYSARKNCGEDPARAEICAKYGITPLRLDNALKKLSAAIKDEEEE